MLTGHAKWALKIHANFTLPLGLPFNDLYDTHIYLLKDNLYRYFVCNLPLKGRF